ncbi:hypothetical protein [Dyadobacter sp. MSC1_007]|jgi:hypothetical protein|nr:hypothetical protein [Dyadobacter sp. MSC1_007]
MRKSLLCMLLTFMQVAFLISTSPTRDRQVSGQINDAGPPGAS